MTFWHAVSSFHFRAHFWRSSRFCFKFPPTSNLFLSFPSFQRAIVHTIWPWNSSAIIVWTWLIFNLHYHTCCWICAWCYLCLQHGLFHTTRTHYLLPCMEQQHMFCVHAHHVQTWPKVEIFFIVSFSLSTVSKSLKSWGFSLHLRLLKTTQIIQTLHPKCSLAFHSSIFGQTTKLSLQRFFHLAKHHTSSQAWI